MYKALIERVKKIKSQIQSMVKVKYGEPYKTSFGKTEEKIKADTLGSLLEKITQKYKGKQYSDVVKYSMIFLNNEKFLNKNDLEYRLKPKDEILIKMMMSGG